jgi:hypothetical protein
MQRSLVLRFGSIGDYVTAVEFCKAHNECDLLFCSSIEHFVRGNFVVQEFLHTMAPHAGGVVIRFGDLVDYDLMVRSGKYRRVILLSQGPGGRKIALLAKLLKLHKWLRANRSMSIIKYFHGGQYVWQLNQASRIADLICALPPGANISIFYDSKEAANNLSAETVAHVVRRLTSRLVRPQVNVYGVKQLKLPTDLQCINLTGCTSLEQLLDVFDQTQLAVVCDSGPLHALSARGIPCIAFMSARQPLLNWTPLTPNNYYIFEDDLDCLGCGRAVCPSGNNICVNSPSTHQKFDAVVS